MKSLAYRLQKIVLGGRMVGVYSFFAIKDERQHSIVWRNKLISRRSGYYRPADSTHPRINDHQMHCSFGKIRICRCDGQCAFENVKGRNAMANVDQLSFGQDLENDSSDRADKMIAQSEVSRQC